MMPHLQPRAAAVLNPLWQDQRNGACSGSWSMRSASRAPSAASRRPTCSSQCVLRPVQLTDTIKFSRCSHATVMLVPVA